MERGAPQRLYGMDVIGTVSPTAGHGLAASGKHEPLLTFVVAGKMAPPRWGRIEAPPSAS
jgi:hypothetical protein